MPSQAPAAWPMTVRAVAGPGGRPMMIRAVAGPGSREMMIRAVAWPGSRPAMPAIGWAAGRALSKDERTVVGLLCRPALTMPLPPSVAQPRRRPFRELKSVAITVSNQCSDISYSLSRRHPS